MNPAIEGEAEEAIKEEAREFMSDLISTAADSDMKVGNGIDMAAWKSAYDASNKDSVLMEKFWSVYDPNSCSLWTMVYDEADSNENLDETIEFSTQFLKQSESLKHHCFGVIHTLETLEIEGLWVFNGPDPEELFGTNEDTSWFTWNQIGPDPNDKVKEAVARFLTPSDGKLNGKTIKNTQAS